jgi:hypothetical protein
MLGGFLRDFDSLIKIQGKRFFSFFNILNIQHITEQHFVKSEDFFKDLLLGLRLRPPALRVAFKEEGAAWITNARV